MRDRIYQVIPYYPPHLGGMQNCAQIIAEYFAKKGSKVTVLTSNIGYTSNGQKRINSNLDVKYLKSFEIAHTPISASLILELIKIPRNSIVHLHVANAFYPEMVYIASLIKGFKYVAHIHIDVQSSGLFGALLPIYKKLALKPVLSRANKIICLTESFKDLMIKKYNIKENNIIVIPNGVDESFFMNKTNKFKTKNNILFVGRLEIQKNVFSLIKTMKQIKKEASLHIIGEGTLKNELRTQIKKLKLNNVVLHGLKRGKSLVSFYKNSDIFILPSKNEGMSLSMLEAMAAGLPIIAVDIPQTRNFLKEGAFLVKEAEPENFAQALDKLVDNPKLQKSMGDNNRVIAGKYKWSNSLKKINKLYLSI